MALAVVAIWGINFSVVKFGLSDYSALAFSTIRFLISFLVLLPFCRFPREHIRSIFILSLTFGLGHFGLFFYGLSLDVQSSTASVLLQTGPPLTVLFGALMYRERVTGTQIIGLVLACIGVASILGLPEKQPGLYPVVILLVCATLWAVSNILMKRLHEVPPLTVICWLSCFTTIELAIVWVLLEGAALPSNPSIWTSLAVCYPALFSTILGYGMWNHLLRHVPISTLAPFGLLVPLFGVAGGVVFLDERFELGHFIGALFLLTGVFCASIYPYWRKMRLNKALLHVEALE